MPVVRSPWPASERTSRARGRRAVIERRRFLAEHPLCSGPDSQCEKVGRITEPRQVDHIIPLARLGTDDPSNKQALCLACHAIKTAKDMGYRMKPKIGPDGYPIDLEDS